MSPSAAGQLHCDSEAGLVASCKFLRKKHTDLTHAGGVGGFASDRLGVEQRNKGRNE
jgi:hypothetical protein